MQKTDIRLDALIIIGLTIFVIVFFVGCGTKKATTDSETSAEVSETKKKGDTIYTVKTEEKPKVQNGALIEIKENSAADTVEVFYDRLREKNYRDAIALTNLRPAIEGMTEDELNDLGVDFGFLAKSIPENMPINGEIITGDNATVTVQMPNEKDGQMEVQEIKLRKENDNWIVLVADKAGEKRIKKEGKNYFFSLRMDVHHAEAQAMIERINKAQMVYRLNNGGRFADLQTLVAKGYVPQDALGSITTGYKYDIALKEDSMLYTALATPAEYGKTGKLSFAYKVTRDKQPELFSKDLRGKSFQN